MIRALALALALLAAGSAAAEDAFKVVVHPTSTEDALARAQLSQLFLKKMTRWPGGQGVSPVEPADDKLRERFCRAVHGKSLNAVRSYWNQLIFSGREVPPLEKPSDDEVLAYVRATPGAIGYVSAAAETPGVKTVSLKE